MADVRPFQGIRYRGAAGADFGRLLAPPYDVAGAAPGAANPFNIGRLEEVDPPAEPGDPLDPHQRAAHRFDAWRRRGVLAADEAPALYLHEQTFAFDGQRLTRRALLARVRLAAWTEGSVLPHERTFPGPVAERLARLRAVGADLSPIYLLAADPTGDLRDLLATGVDSVPTTMEGDDPIGDRHRLYVRPEPDFAERARAILAPRRLYVADGHHRYEAALAYRDERRAADQAAGDDRPAFDFVLAAIASLADEGVRVRPTHRLVRLLPNFDPAAVRARLARWFDLRRGAETPSAQPGTENDELCRLLFAGDSAPWTVRAPPGAPHAALMPAARSAAWRNLPVAIVEQIILGATLGLATDDPSGLVVPTVDAAEAVAAVAANRAQLAILLPPPSLPAIVAVADAGDTLPPKATSFVPKAPAGLVIYEVEESRSRAVEE